MRPRKIFSWSAQICGSIWDQKGHTLEPLMFNNDIYHHIIIIILLLFIDALLCRPSNCFTISIPFSLWLKCYSSVLLLHTLWLSPVKAFKAVLDFRADVLPSRHFLLTAKPIFTRHSLCVIALIIARTLRSENKTSQRWKCICLLLCLRENILQSQIGPCAQTTWKHPNQMWLSVSPFIRVNGFHFSASGAVSLSSAPPRDLTVT